VVEDEEDDEDDEDEDDEDDEDNEDGANSNLTKKRKQKDVETLSMSAMIKILHHGREKILTARTSGTARSALSDAELDAELNAFIFSAKLSASKSSSKKPSNAMKGVIFGGTPQNNYYLPRQATADSIASLKTVQNTPAIAHRGMEPQPVLNSSTSPSPGSAIATQSRSVNTSDSHGAQLAERIVPTTGVSVTQGQSSSATTSSASASSKAANRIPTAYRIFAKEKRPEVKTKNPGATFSEICNTVARMWEHMSEVEREPYTAKRSELAAAATESGALITSGRFGAQPDERVVPSVKRVPSAFIIFSMEKRDEVKAQNPGATFGEIGSMLGTLWGEMSEEEREPYMMKRSELVLNELVAAGRLNASDPVSLESEENTDHNPSKRTRRAPRIFEPVAWTQSTVRKPKTHEDVCFCCEDGGLLIECSQCPKVYHKECLCYSRVPSGSWACPWHSCIECDRNTSNSGGMQFRCLTCPITYCFDCFPTDLEMKRTVPSPAYVRSYEKHGFEISKNTIFYKCKYCLTQKHGASETTSVVVY